MFHCFFVRGESDALARVVYLATVDGLGWYLQFCRPRGIFSA